MINSELQAELRARFNPDGSKLRNMQLKILDILKTIDKICRDNDIPYWLASGTLIGAVRHGGFIPWDDDLDIEILYSDRKRFVKACMEHLPSKYVLQCHETDKTYYSNILKVRDLDGEIHEVMNIDGINYPIEYKYNGFFVDVFTVEKSVRPYVYISIYLTRLLYKLKCKWQLGPNMLSIWYNVFNGIYGVFRFLSKLCPSGWYYLSYGSWFISRRVRAELIPPKDILFEGISFYGPADPDSYLRRIYGDYMRLPDIENWKPTHETQL